MINDLKTKIKQGIQKRILSEIDDEIVADDKKPIIGSKNMGNLTLLPNFKRLYFL